VDGDTDIIAHPLSQSSLRSAFILADYHQLDNNAELITKIEVRTNKLNLEA
jgi:hypothetical protein